MKKLNNQYIVQLLGVYIDAQHGHGIVTELMENSLEKELKSELDKIVNGTGRYILSKMIHWLACIASG